MAKLDALEAPHRTADSAHISGETTPVSTSEDSFGPISEAELARLEQLEAPIKTIADAVIADSDMNGQARVAVPSTEDHFNEFSEEDLALFDAMEKEALTRNRGNFETTSCDHVEKIPAVCLRCVALDVLAHADRRHKEVKHIHKSF